MANKPFAIQGSDLTLGGVNLSAGSTGIVIPGVTQAATYFVEEVNDRGDQTLSFQTAPILIDYVTYLDYQNNGSSSNRAEYSVDEIDNEGYIDGITVDTAGEYTGSEAYNGGNDLFAYTGTDTMPGIFTSFVDTDWTQIPYRPKMRAGEVENIGGGNANTGNFTFSNDTISNDNGLILDTDRGTLAIGTNMEVPGVAGHFHIAFNGSNSNPPAGDLFLGDDYNYVKLPGSELESLAQYGVEIGTDSRGIGPQNIEVFTVDELVPPGGVWRFFIDHEDYPNLGASVKRGDTVTTAWGTPITATITEVVEEPGLQWKIHVAQDITAGFEASVDKTVSFSSNSNSKYWRFGTDGSITFPDNTVQTTAYTGDTGVSYKGFKAVYGRMYDSEPTISKVLIYQDAVTLPPTIEVDTDTSRDLFKVSGLAGSGVIALVNVYGADDTDPTALPILKQFVRSVVDNVILFEGLEGNINSAADMKTNFYNNFAKLASLAGDRYQDFKFNREEWFDTPVTGGSGTGATFNIYRDPDDDTVDYEETNQPGVNYEVNDVLTILGTALGGTSPANDIVITVTQVGLGGQIEDWSIAGTLPNNLFPLDNIEDGGSDQYDGANYIFTNIQGDSYIANNNEEPVSRGAWALNYNSGNVASGTPWFGAHSEYVTAYNLSIFGLFVTGANIDWIATNGNSGFDGDGQVDTGSLQLFFTDKLNSGDQTLTVNNNGSVTFPDGSVQTTAYTGGNLNTWVQTFETSLRVADIPAVATSVEYLNNGDIVALFVNLKDINLGFGDYNTYTGVARFDKIGRLVWSMNFQGNDMFEQFTDGWGLAVDNANDYIYVAGQVGALFGGNAATLTKLSQLDGGVEWSKIYDVGYNNSNTVVDVASDGNPIVVGYADNGDDNQVVTTKINGANGTVIWSRALDGQGDEEAYGMAVGPTNEVVTVGYMENIEYPGPTRTILTLTANPLSDPAWTNNLIGVTNGGLTFDVTFTDGVASFSNIVDTTGNHYAGEPIGVISAGSLGAGSTNLQFIVGTTTTEDLSNRMLIVKYAGNGTIDWQKSVAVEADYDCTGADADIDSAGNIYVCGNFEQDGDSAMIIIKFNNMGVKQWTRKVEGNCGNFANSIVVGSDDHLYLSAVTDNGTFPNHNYNLVIAKYNLDGTVAWQRLLDNTTTSTFGGAWWFTNSGGSNLAVKDGYVAVAGSFGEIYGPSDVTAALVAQFDTAGTEFEIGDYEFVAATFSGTLDSSASNITVANAAKADSDYAGEFTVTDFTPTVNTTGDLIGTLYYGDSGSDDRLTNGANNLVLTPAGAVTLPRGGTISEGVVTSNPTIQLTPARPDVASQKLVIKGGGIGYYVQGNGLSLSWNYTNTNIGSTINFSVYSDTYVGQTLYWWVYPENVGLVDVDHGQVIVPSGGSGGNFSILIDSDDYEFTVRVSPENNNYDPDNVGVESWLFNGEAPTYPEHHLHLTTGNLAETSVFLGTDNHNVRTTLDGGIQVTTQTTTVELPHTMTISGADFTGVNLVYTRAEGISPPKWTSPVSNPVEDPYIQFVDGEYGIFVPAINPAVPIYVNTGTLATPLALWNTNPPYGSVAPTGIYTYLTPDVHVWTFSLDGSTTLPGAVVKSTVAKDGPTLPTTTGALSSLNHNFTFSGLTDGTYGPFTLGVVTFRILVSGGTISSFVNASATGNVTVNDVLGTIGSGDLGGAPGLHTITITVQNVVQATPVALDLTKSVNKLTGGIYTLADGVEGQIMYLVKQTGTVFDTVTVIVANARVAGVLYTNLEHYPFSYNTSSIDIDTLIFTDGAWQAVGGEWD